MSPTIIFDKSAFQTVSRQEHIQRLFRFHECITPVLLVEILADLAKAKPLRGKGADEQVQILAKKFLGSGGAVSMNARQLVRASLLGAVVPMDGRIIAEDVKYFREADGSLAAVVLSGAGNEAVMRWAKAVFHEEERSIASALRERAKGFSTTKLRRTLDGHRVLLPRASSVSDIPGIVDDLLSRTSLQHAFLDWCLDEFPLETWEHNAVVARWDAAPMYLARFAPYAFHCVRTLLCLLVGTVSKVLSQRPTNRTDVEYLFYVPFADVFVSGDTLHRQLYPMVSTPAQLFIHSSDFKADLQRLAAERSSMTDEQVSRRNFAFGSRPWPARGSVLWDAWGKLRGPWRAGSGNRATKLSEDEQQLALDEAAALVAAVDAVDA